PPPSITIFIPGWISTLDGTHDASYNINGSPTRTPPTGQNVPGQFTASGVNGLLIVPEMAVNARLSDPGRFRDPQFLPAFLTEALQNAARMHIPGDDNDSDIRTRRERFVQQMMRSEVPINLVGFSGGGRTVAEILRQAQGTDLGGRIRGITLLDAAYTP